MLKVRTDMFKKLLLVISVMVVMCLCICSCDNDKNKSNYIASVSQYVLTDIVPVGDYVNEKDECIRVLKDNTIQFVGFNEDDFVKSYSDAMKENEVSEEDFRTGFQNPYNIDDVNDGYTEGTYKIGLPLMGNDKIVRYMVIYDPTAKTMKYHGSNFVFKE